MRPTEPFAAIPLLLALALAPPAARAGDAPPFDATPFVGERLTYSVRWNPPWYMFFLPDMEAGELELELAGVDLYRGKPALRIDLRARSSGALAKLANMAVDDRFTFYSDPGTLCAAGGTTRIREGGRKRLLELEYFQDERRLRFRATDEAATPPKLQRDVTKDGLPPCVQDPFSASYLYRTLPLGPGYAKRLVIGNDDKVMEVDTRIDAREEVSTPAGRFAAWKVGTDALKGGLFREGGQFHVWIAADGSRAPVKFEAKVRLGHIVGVLKGDSKKSAGGGEGGGEGQE
ncbi:MAG: DUF3108 domain-containing protein [Acidobacteriota bacterium]|jgi:hypothetical protein|nr:DUF3108 domain-containing protein [Acidobacteriota bacterium]